MNYEQFVREQLRKPVSLTVYILLSVIAFMQMISLFLGRWIDIIEFASVVLLVVTAWIAFSQAVSKKKINRKQITSCLFAWSVVKLVSVGLALFMVVISSIYMCVVNSDFGYDNRLMVTGILTLLLAGGIYGVRLVIAIFALKDSTWLKYHEGGVYLFGRNWFVWGIVSAGLRFAGMLVLILVSAVCGKVFDVLAYWGSSGFAGIISNSMSIGGIVMVSLIDLCYAAVFVLFAIIIKGYNSALGAGKN